MNSLILGFFIFCHVDHEGVTCQKIEDNVHAQKVYISSDEIEAESMVCDIYRKQIGTCNWYSIKTCEAVTKGAADCILIPLAKSWKR